MTKDVHGNELTAELNRVVHQLEGIDKRISQIERHHFFQSYRPLPAWLHHMVDAVDAWCKQWRPRL
jgi:hypothetical protein